MNDSNTVFKNFEKEIKENNIVLYMKGTRNAPMCGFSNLIVQILKEMKINNYLDVNVMSDDQIRQGIKEFTKWPTIPQLYIKGKFIGGADIIQEMYQSGELQKIVN
jgi:monothiol glutaredoxin